MVKSQEAEAFRLLSSRPTWLYKVSSRTVKATRRNPVLKKKRQQQQNKNKNDQMIWIDSPIKDKCKWWIGLWKGFNTISYQGVNTEPTVMPTVLACSPHLGWGGRIICAHEFEASQHNEILSHKTKQIVPRCVIFFPVRMAAIKN